MQCQNCGAANPAGYKFCGGCGAPLASPQPSTLDLRSDSPVTPPQPKNLVYFWGIGVPTLIAFPIVLCVVGICAAISFVPSLTARPSTPDSSADYEQLTLSDIYRCCDGMTTAKRDQYFSSLVGKRVRWQGNIKDVYSFGTATIEVNGYSVTVVSISPSTVAKLKKNQSIDFVAEIAKVQQPFLLPDVQLSLIEIK